MSPSNFQVLSPLMLWIPLGSSPKGVDDAGSDHRSEGLCVLDHIIHQNIGCCFCLFQLISICSCQIQTFLNRFETWQSSFHNTLTVWGERSALGGVDDEFPDAHVGRVPSRFVATVPLTRLFIAFDLLFLTVFCSIWVIKITLANLILPQSNELLDRKHLQRAKSSAASLSAPTFIVLSPCHISIASTRCLGETSWLRLTKIVETIWCHPFFHFESWEFCAVLRCFLSMPVPSSHQILWTHVHFDMSAVSTGVDWCIGFARLRTLLTA